MSGKSQPVILHRLRPETVSFRVRARHGSTLLSHRFSDEARQAIRDKQQGKAVQKKKKDPQAEYHSSIYWIDESNLRYGIPAAAFKRAMTTAANDMKIKQTEARRWFFVLGCESNPKYCEIEGSEPEMREDVVPVGMGTDLHYRAEFAEWEANVRFEFDPGLITAEILANLLDRAGFSVGVLDWRPEKNGDHGRFEIVT